MIQTTKAPRAIGPYSQAVCVNGQLYVSGQIPIDPNTNELVKGGMVDQTKQVLNNLIAILDEANFVVNDVVKTTIYLTDLTQFSIVNDLYAEVFNEHKPARATVQVAKLPKGSLIEVDCIAIKSNV
jgi:2-iminobutanoate/2-iminopropanoate deaminase